MVMPSEKAREIALAQGKYRKALPVLEKDISKHVNAGYLSMSKDYKDLVDVKEAVDALIQAGYYVRASEVFGKWIFDISW
jgi:hypothetical protein